MVHARSFCLSDSLGSSESLLSFLRTIRDNSPVPLICVYAPVLFSTLKRTQKHVHIIAAADHEREYTMLTLLPIGGALGFLADAWECV